MNKHEARIAEYKIKAEKFALIVGVVRLTIVCGVVLGAIYLVMNGLQGLIGATEGQIGAMAALVSSLDIGGMIGYCVAAITTVGFLVQRKVAKRAISEKTRYQQKLESADSHRSTSRKNSTESK